MQGRIYMEAGEPVLILVRWGSGGGPRNVLIRRASGARVVRPFRGLRKPQEEQRAAWRAFARAERDAAPGASERAVEELMVRLRLYRQVKVGARFLAAVPPRYARGLVLHRDLPPPARQLKLWSSI